jgi:hypothetical protein
MSVKDRTVLAPMASLDLYTGRISGFMEPDKMSRFLTTMSNRTSLLRVVLLLLEGE